MDEDEYPRFEFTIEPVDYERDLAPRGKQHKLEFITHSGPRYSSGASQYLTDAELDEVGSKICAYKQALAENQ